MQTSLAPISHASTARRTTSSMGRKYPSSSRWSRLNAQNVQCLMQTFVKLMLRFTTYVTRSPACRRRISSATSVRAWRSRPATPVSVMPSSTDTSWPSSARARIGRTSRETQSSEASRLPAAPVFMGFLDQAALVDQVAHARAQALVEELRARRELGIDGQALAEDEALTLGRAPELGDQRPRLLGVDVVERERRDAAPVVEPGGQQARVDTRRQIWRRLDVHVRPQDEPRDRQRAQEIVERGLGRVAHRDPRLRAEVLDDDFLDVAVALLRVADRHQRVGALARRLADADQEPGGERDAELAGQPDRPQAARRYLVGRPVMGAAGRQQPLGDRLEHQ